MVMLCDLDAQLASKLSRLAVLRTLTVANLIEVVQKAIRGRSCSVLSWPESGKQ